MSEEENKNEVDGTEDHKPTKGEKAAAAADKAKSTAAIVKDKAATVGASIKGHLKTAFDKATDNSPGRVIRATFNVLSAVTYPVRKIGGFAAKQAWNIGVATPTKMWWNASKWGATRESKILQGTVPLVATGLLGAWFTATQYSALYGLVAAGDRYWFGAAYESGERTGTITTLSMRGKFPCNSMEGELSMPNIRGDGSSTFPFSIRRFGDAEQQAAWAAYESGDTVSINYDVSHWPTEWFDSEREGWFVPFIGLSQFECVQKTDHNVTNVTIREGRVLPAPPRLTPGE
ncbi:MAG: hypothetical protein VXY16_06920 [Pseudomonadota bacterium]|nr:hypothetical protein [Pseudomonadota bacterium]